MHVHVHACLEHVVNCHMNRLKTHVLKCAEASLYNNNNNNSGFIVRFMVQGPYRGRPH